MARKAVGLGAIGAAALVLASAGVAQAQFFSPFRRSSNAPNLETTDLRLLLDTTQALNQTASLRVGDSDDWTNPRTGNSGRVAVTRLFASNGLPCHALRYTVFYKANRPDRTYDADWCKTAAGDWKIKS